MGARHVGHEGEEAAQDRLRFLDAGGEERADLPGLMALGDPPWGSDRALFGVAAAVERPWPGQGVRGAIRSPRVEFAVWNQSRDFDAAFLYVLYLSDLERSKTMT
jgi:hypothetical protein